MLVLYLLLVCSGTLAYVRRLDKPYYDLEDADNLFESYIKKYNKQYENEQEKEMRFAIFKKNLIELNNLNSAEDQQHAVFGLSVFTDLTKEEIKSRYLGLKVDQSVLINASTVPVEITIDLPDKFDWREHNAVTPVKNQEKCGSCWAFSTTGTVEGAYAIKHKELLSFSEQQLVDCDEDDGGCHGGFMSTALKYIQKAGGLVGESDYPYEAQDNSCRFDKSKVKVKVTGQKAVPMNSDDALKQFLIQNGPISIAIDAGPFVGYKGGILNCVGSALNHGVLLVGYGSENGLPYWLIKNSWGTVFGEQGYARVKATANPCNMKNKAATIALVA